MTAPDEEAFARVDGWIARHLLPADPALEAVLKANHKAGLPAIDVSPLLGAFLGLMCQLVGARRVLEIGTLGGYSTIAMAKALPADGHVVTLELNARHAEVARANFARADVVRKVDLRVGAALDLLPGLVDEGHAFDLAFIDADKENNAAYADWAATLVRPGGLVIVDNVVRGDQLALGRHVDAVVARESDGRRSDAQVHLARARLEQQAHNLARGRTPHDGVVHHHQPLACNHLAQGREFETHALLAQPLLRLNESARRVAVLNQPVAVGDARFGGVADRRRRARIGHGDHQVRVHRMLSRQNAPHPSAHLVQQSAVQVAVGAGEVDEFEHAQRVSGGGQPLVSVQPVGVDDDNLAWGDLADKLRANRREGAGLRRQHPRRAQPAQRQRAHTIRVAHANQLRRGQNRQRVRAPHLAHHRADGVHNVRAVLQRTRHQAHDDLRVVGRLELLAFGFKLRPQAMRVHQVAVVRDGDVAMLGRAGNRLHIAQGGRACGGVAGVPDGNIALQALQHRLRKHARDQSEVFVGADARAVRDGDARAFLPAMLQSVQSEERQARDVGARGVDAEDAAGLARPVQFVVPHPLPHARVVGHSSCSARSSATICSIAACCACAIRSRKLGSANARILAANNAAPDGSNTTAGAMPEGMRSDEKRSAKRYSR